ncbi:MAG: HpcH/HpaI aldolase/citrate lyase family protein [Rhodospirillales bacterium]|jgi:citrate lyase subunit beta/citryl-CoA lyase
MNKARPAAPGEHEPWVIRSMLFMPVNEERFVAKAHTRGADAIILDLEDSVALSKKPDARKMVPEAAARIAGAGVDVVVRINSPIRLGIPDLEAVICKEIMAIWLPKTESPEHVRMIAETIGELEAERGIPVGTIWMGARVETAKGFMRINEIASADPRVRTLGLGGEDFSLSIGVEPAIDTLIYPKQHAIIAAHAAGVAPVGLMTSSANFSDLDDLRHIVSESRRFGFEGATCIHPTAVPILNEGFRPRAEDVAHAQKVSDAFEEAIKQGKASIQVEGRMVDYPVAYRAHGVLKRDAMIRAKEARTANI